MSETELLITRDEDIERASRSIKAMSHPLRLKILCALGDNEVNVQDIVDMVGTSQSNISQHLAILRDKGILMSRKDANRVFYRVGDARPGVVIILNRLRLLRGKREIRLFQVRGGAAEFLGDVGERHGELFIARAEELLEERRTP